MPGNPSNNGSTEHTKGPTSDEEDPGSLSLLIELMDETNTEWYISLPTCPLGQCLIGCTGSFLLR